MISLILADIKFISIPAKFKYFFDLDYLSNYRGVKLPKTDLNIRTVLVSAHQEGGGKQNKVIMWEILLILMKIII